MSQDDLGGPEIGKYMLQGLFRVCQNDAEWKWSKKRQHLVSKIMVFAFRPKRTKRLLGHFSLGQNLGNGWSKSIVLENKVVLHFDFNQVIWVPRSGFFFLAGYHAQGHNLNVFRTFSDTMYPKRPKEDERVTRGHFQERVQWLPPGLGPTPIPFSFSRNGPFENSLRCNSIFI